MRKSLLFLLVFTSILMSSDDGYETDRSPSSLAFASALMSLYDGYEADRSFGSSRSFSCGYSSDPDFNFKVNLQKSACQVLKEALINDDVCSKLVEIAYEIPQFRHRVREIVTERLTAACSDPIILQIAQDISQLRSRVSPLVQALLKENCDPKILQTALDIPKLRVTALTIIEKFLTTYDEKNYNPEVLRVALAVPELKQKTVYAIGKILAAYGVDNYNPQMLSVAYDTYYRGLVAIIVESIFEKSSNDPEILQIALGLESFYSKALDKVATALLEKPTPQIIRLALQLKA